MNPKLCTHIMPTGKTCGSPALRHQTFCYFHHEGRKQKSRKARAAAKCSCPYYPRIPMNPDAFTECPAVIAARLGISSPVCAGSRKRAA
jgi:hypothetical protein